MYFVAIGYYKSWIPFSHISHCIWWIKRYHLWYNPDIPHESALISWLYPGGIVDSLLNLANKLVEEINGGHAVKCFVW